MINISINPRKISRIKLAWSSVMIDAGMAGLVPEVILSKNRSRPLMKNQKISAPATGPKTRAAPPISRTV